MQINKKYALIAASTLVVIFMAYIFIINPAITGYSIYKNAQGSNHSVDTYTKKISDLENELKLQETNLSACISHNKDLRDLIKNFSDSMIDCEKKIYKLRDLINKTKKESEQKIIQITEEKEQKTSDFKEKINNLREKISNRKDTFNRQIENLANNYSALALSSAKTICCKKKVDNQEISHYRVEDNEVICLEAGQKELDCNS